MSNKLTNDPRIEQAFRALKGTDVHKTLMQLHLDALKTLVYHNDTLVVQRAQGRAQVLTSILDTIGS